MEIDKEQKACIARLREAIRDCEQADLVFYKTGLVEDSSFDVVLRSDYNANPGLPLEKLPSVTIYAPFKHSMPKTEQKQILLNSTTLTDLAKEHKAKVDAYFGSFEQAEYIAPLSETSSDEE